MLKTFKRHFFSAASFLILLFMSKFIKLGTIFGVLKGNFLASQVLMPLSGIISGGFGIISILILSVINIFSFNFTLYSLATAYHIPSLFASLSLFKSQNKALNLFFGLLNYMIPVLCALLFIANPVGFQIPLYTVYWLVPVVITVLGAQNMFLRALRATFIAHAIGTVIFIYSVQSDVNLWANLAKIVWLERIVIACSMTMCYKVLVFAKSKFETKNPISGLTSLRNFARW